MIAKIVRITLVAALVFALAFKIPVLYKKVFEKYQNNPEIVYSEVLDDFLLVTSEQDIKTQKYVTSAVDTKGNKYDKDQIAGVTPARSFRQLEYEGRFPDSICGVAVTPEIIQNSYSFPAFIGASDRQRSPLLWMFESQTDRVSMTLPDDVYRIGKKGIEFIDVADNKINKEKSKLFNDALLSAGFVAPSVRIYGMTSLRKSVDEGYFIIDSNNDLYHVKMANAQPQIVKVPLPEGVVPHSMNCMSGAEFYGYFYDTNMNIYLMDNPSYELKRLPIDDYATMPGTIVVESNMFYTTFNMRSGTHSKKYILDSNYDLKRSYEIKLKRYADTKTAQTENYIYPMKIALASDGGIDISMSDRSKFIWLNLALMVVLLVIKLINRRKVYSIFNIIDLLFVGVFGIFGFISVLIFPNRR